jgi:phosphohistidine swiveling domain-containing protein
VANAVADLREGELVTLELGEGVVHRGARSPISFPVSAGL